MAQNPQLLKRKRIVDDTDENIKSINDLLKKEKQKKEKKVKPKEEYLISTGRRRIIKRPSVVAETASDLIRLGYNTPDSIRSYFDKKGRIVDEQQRRLYLLLVKSKISMGKFVLSDDLANTPVSLYLACSNFKSNIISNDWIWLALLYCRKIEDETKAGGFLFGKKALFTLFAVANIKEVQIVSDSFKCGKDVEKGYYQDFFTNFACIGLDKKSQNEIKDICKSEPYKFGYFGYTFLARGDVGSGRCIICTDNEDNTAELIQSRAENCKVISIDEKKPVLREKIINIKNEVVRLIDCVVKPEKFCPAFLRTDENVNYTFLFHSVLNYNDLFDAMDSTINNGTVNFYDNSWFWDNTESWFSFLYVYVITTRVNLSDIFKKKIVGWCDFFYQYYDMIIALKKNQMFLQKIYEDFVSSFVSKINYDKVKSLRDKIKEYIGFRDFLVRDINYKKIIDWINELPFCTYIKNQFKEEVMQISDDLFNCLDDLIEKRSSVDDLTTSFRRIAELIYYCCPTDLYDSTFRVAFPFIFSPAGVLGYIFNVNQLGDVLTSNLIKVRNQAENKDKVLEKRLNDLQLFYSDVEKNKKGILKYNIDVIAKKEDVLFTNEEENIMVDEMLKQLVSNPGFNKEFNDKIFATIRDGGNLSELIIQHSDFVNPIKQKCYEKKQAISQANAQNAQYQNQINNLANAINKNNEIINQSVQPVQSQAYSTKEESSISDIGMKDRSDAPIMTSKNLDDYDFSIREDKTSNWSKFQHLIKDGRYNKDKTVSQYYSAIAYLSGLFPSIMRIDDGKTNLQVLMQNYPLRPSLFEVVTRQYNLPSDYSFIKEKFGKYGSYKSNKDFSKTENVRKILYTNLGY